MRNFEIIERGEHYFRCNIDGIRDKHCRIIIDENSNELPIGKFRLHVEEITDIYQHHAMDAVFRLTLPFSEQDSIDICTLNAGRKNRFTYRICVKLGGKWEPIINEWVFSASIKEKVDQLGKIVHSKPVIVEVTFKETISEPGKNLTLFGFELVKGLNINHTPMLHKSIRIKKGDLTYIVGKDSKTIIQAGSIIRLSVPKLMLEASSFKEDYFSALQYKIVRQ